MIDTIQVTIPLALAPQQIDLLSWTHLKQHMVGQISMYI